MFRSSRLALFLGLAGGLAGLPGLIAQTNPDIAAAIRFQKAEDAAAARQARIEAGRGGPAQPSDRDTAQQKVKPEGVAAAVRFQQAEDAAAARQARIEAGRGGELNSADRMVTAPKTKTKTARTTSAAARKTSQ